MAVFGGVAFLTWLAQGGLDDWLDRHAKHKLQSLHHDEELTLQPAAIQQIPQHLFDAVHVSIIMKALLCLLSMRGSLLVGVGEDDWL